MKYSIDYPDHELAKFIGQLFTCRHELHLVYCSSIASVRKTYDDKGKPYELTIYTDGGSSYTFEENSEKLNNPDYTINGSTIGVKPNETQQALRNSPQNQRTSCLERILKKIHNSPDPANSTPPKPKPKPINYSFKVVCTVDSWDTGTTTNLSYETLKVSARDYHHALEIASKHFNTPERTPHIIANTSEFTARWYSDDACEEIGSEITISISPVN